MESCKIIEDDGTLLVNDNYLEQMDDGLDGVKMEVFPHKALQIKQSWILWGIRKPHNMPI